MNHSHDLASALAQPLRLPGDHAVKRDQLGWYRLAKRRAFVANCAMPSPPQPG